VITTRFNGAAELMAEGRGGRVLNHPGDLSGLATALKDILDTGRLDAYREQAAELGIKHDFNHHIARMEQWILEA
jgi:hypothetical protein